MRESLGLSVVLYAVALTCALAIAAGLGAASGRPRTPFLTAALVILELAAVGQAGLDAVALLEGRHGPEVATNIGYLLTSLAVLPVAGAAVGFDQGRWGSAALAVGCALLAVVSLRLHATLGVAHA